MSSDFMVISAVTLGLPSRSPPIQVPSEMNGGTSMAVSGIVLGDRFFQVAIDLGHDVDESRHNVDQAGAYFVEHRQLCRSHFVGEPDLFDRVG